MAAIAVFDTAELLEAILLNLPLRDTLLAQKVSRIWRDTIAGSPNLQRALFFKPVNDLVFSQQHEELGFAVRDCISRFACEPKNHFSSSGFASLSLGPNITPIRTLPRRGTRTQTPVKTLVNPFVALHFPWICLDYHEKEDLRSMNDCFTSKDASWRKMLLTQPPLAGVLFDCGKAHHFHRLPAEGPKEPLTLQDMHDAAATFYGKLFVPQFEANFEQEWSELTGEDVLAFRTRSGG